MSYSLTGDRKGRQLFRYRTHCKLCLLAIGWGDPAVWLTKPMGLSHEACAAREVGGA